MTRDQMRRHAEAWIAAWNVADVERVLADFAEDARFVSPRAAQVTGEAELHGKTALRAYWRAAMAKLGTPQFRLDHLICDVERGEMLVVYDRLNDGKIVRACELMRFDTDGRQVYGEAMYGAELPNAASRA
jgi:ketosteroid isomerase-like protein